MHNKKNEKPGGEVDDIIIEDEVSEAGDSFEVSDEEEYVADKIKAIKKKLNACLSEKQEYLNGWQRSKADYVNALKRFESEKESTRAFAVSRTVEAFLPAIDSLERATAVGKLPEGFDAIVKQLSGAFSALGVEEMVVAPGDAFNPKFHEALGQEDTDDPKKDDTVTLVLEKGWRIGDMIVRHAKVRVARYTQGS